MSERDYEIDVDQVAKQEWSELLNQFSDTTINQTWSYGSVRWGEANLSHLVLKRGGEVLAAAQTGILKVPILNAGVAHISLGPLWTLRNKQRDFTTLQWMIRALHDEYSVKRRLLLRVIMNTFDCDPDRIIIDKIIRSEGFTVKPSSYHTLLLDLGPSIDELRMNLTKEWRKNLKYAEGKKLTIVEGFDDDLFQIVRSLYREMRLRKNFVVGINIDQLGATQRDLPESMKMKLILCKADGQPVAGLMSSSLGDIGIDLVAATGNKALTLNASYFLRWHVVQWLKDMGCRFYDLGGIDQKRNPGGYHFKMGLAGKSAQPTRYIGQLEDYQNYLSSIIVKGGELVKKGYSKIINR
jgi:hypothetical protein